MVFQALDQHLALYCAGLGQVYPRSSVTFFTTLKENTSISSELHFSILSAFFCCKDCACCCERRSWSADGRLRIRSEVRSSLRSMSESQEVGMKRAAPDGSEAHEHPAKAPKLDETNLDG